VGPTRTIPVPAPALTYQTLKQQVPAALGWPRESRPQSAERIQAFGIGGPAAFPQPQRAGGPTAIPGPSSGGERPTRKGKKRPKSAVSKSSSGARGGGVGGYEINVFGPNGGRSYTIVDGLPPPGPVVGRPNSAEAFRGGSGSYARPPRQAAKPRPEGGEEKDGAELSPWKNDKHWVGHSLQSQEAAQDMPFLS